MMGTEKGMSCLALDDHRACQQPSSKPFVFANVAVLCLLSIQDTVNRNIRDEKAIKYTCMLPRR